ALPAEIEKHKTMRYWVAGVLVDNEIYLFDTRLGLAIPGPSHVGVATLRQVAAKPELLKQLTVDPNLRYDVSREQVKGAEILVCCSLAAMSPRMKHLHGLRDSLEGIRLWGEPIEGLKRFKKAAKANGLAETQVRGWNQSGDFNTPVRVTRYFLPPPEGG